MPNISTKSDPGKRRETVHSTFLQKDPAKLPPTYLHYPIGVGRCQSRGGVRSFKFVPDQWRTLSVVGLAHPPHAFGALFHMPSLLKSPLAPTTRVSVARSSSRCSTLWIPGFSDFAQLGILYDFRYVPLL
jgi:hypothetical protein